MAAHCCAGGLKKKMDIRSGSHAIDISWDSLSCPSKHQYGATLFTIILRNRPFQSTFTTRLGIRETYSHFKPQGPHGDMILLVAQNKISYIYTSQYANYPLICWWLNNNNFRSMQLLKEWPWHCGTSLILAWLSLTWSVIFPITSTSG